MGSLEATLKKSQEYAARGCSLAEKSIATIEASLAEEREKAAETQKRLSRIRRGEDTNILERQQISQQQSEEMLSELKKKIQALKVDEKEFTIVVYGRTMVGKSTLMEVLTHGNGASIGKGGQRTTRDRRDYYWQGMRVIDVPGIAAFDGEEDDKVAEEAANAADMILFLISDDGVQQEEAKHLAYLRKLGKPILGLINVKVGISDKPRPLDLRRIEKRMAEKERIESVCNQFRAFGGEFHQDWGDITFIPAHLKAAYLGQDTNAELWHLSNFAAVEQYIIDKVEKDGCFLRIKNFVDTVAYSLRNRLAELVENSGNNIAEGLLYRQKCNDLLAWKGKFVERVQKKYDTFYERLQKQIENGIEDFAEDNYENENAGEDWKEYLQEDLNIDGECEKFLRDIAREWNRKKREVMDDFRQEVRFSGIKVDVGDISMDEVTDWKTIAQVGTGIVTLLGPVGWIGAGLAQLVVALLFDSKSERVEKQKAKLVENLQEAMGDVIPQIANKVVNILNEKIFDEGVNGLADALNTRDDLLMALADAEEVQSQTVANQLKEVNLLLWQDACKYLEEEELPLYAMARIPGHIDAYGPEDLSSEEQSSLSMLLDARVQYHVITENEYKDGKFFDKAYGDVVSRAVILYGTKKGSAENDLLACSFEGSEEQMKEFQQSERYQLYCQLLPVPLYV